jgi:uncharacterized caspase-like protein
MGDRKRARTEFEKAVVAGRGRNLRDIHKSGYDTAIARLAALDSGALQPVIRPSLPKPTSLGSLPTPAAPVAIPAPVAQPSAAPSGHRVALVIGNAAYGIGKLANSLNDAELVGKLFQGVGFSTVTVVKEAGREKMLDALRAFANEAEKADWAIVYFAGHGVEIGGVNYLLPVDARLATDRDVQFEAIALDQVLAAIEQAKKLRLVMLDACRDNPFVPAMRRTATAAPATHSGAPAGSPASSTRSVGRGLGRLSLSSGSGTLIFYAAKHGQMALDGDGANSPFAVALAQRLTTPGVEIDKVLRLIRDDVMEATAGRQEPYTYGSLPGREAFYLVAGR